MWTHFYDMHSGGGQKLDWGHIYIEAPRDEAERIFAARFGRRADKVTCSCCGEDYSVSSEEDLAQLTAFQRNCRSVESRRGDDGGFITPPKYYLEDGEQPPEGWLVDERFKRYQPYMTLAEYIKSDGVKVIPTSEIAPHERAAALPERTGWTRLE